MRKCLDIFCPLHCNLTALLKASLSKLGKCQKQMHAPPDTQAKYKAVHAVLEGQSRYVFAVIFFKQYLNILLGVYKSFN